MTETKTQFTVDEFHDLFTASLTEYPEEPRAVHHRWARVVRYFPEVAKLKLHGRMEAVYEKALSGNNLMVEAAIDLVRLQVRYWWLLRESGRIFAHQHEHENTQAFVWQMKLIARYNATTPAKRGKFRIKPEKVAEIPSPRWLN